MMTYEYRLTAQGFVPFIRDAEGNLHQVAVAALSLAQIAFLSCCEVEAGLAGNRGGGKTETMVIDFLSGIGRGWGANYKGVLIRQSQREMSDLIRMLDSIIKPIWPKAAFNKLKNYYEWPTGEVLELSYFDVPEDFDLYQGKSYVWIGFEELTLWPDLKCFLLMLSCLRSPIPDIPRKIRFTCNPSGVGHNAVKHRYNLHGVPTEIAGPAIIETNKDGSSHSRRMIFASYDDNVILRRTDPGYMRNIEEACAGDPAKLKAWKYGDWSVVSGGAFDGIFFDHTNTIYEDEFEIPASGYCFMSYDDGDSKPSACLFWYLNSEGCDIKFKDGRVRSGRPGDLHLVGEYYHWSGVPNEGIKGPITDKLNAIQQYKINRGWRRRDPMTGNIIDYFKGRKGRGGGGGVADNSIFDEWNGTSVANEFLRPVRINGENVPGIEWTAADKKPGSRVAGFTLMRERLIATAPRPGSNRREGPALFVVKEQCPHFCRTVPVLPRDKRNPDDVDSNAEDHIFDACRYALRYDPMPDVWIGSLNQYNQRRQRRIA